MTRLAAVLLLALVTAGCGGTGTAPRGGSAGCEDVSAQLVEAISKGLTVPGATLRGAQAVRSNIGGRGWYVTADIEGPGLSAKDDLATWTTTDLSGNGKILAAGAFAREWSEWESLDGFEHSDHGYAESRACVTDKLR